jgi:hypothetical protein
MMWNMDLFMEAGYISRQIPALDFFLYSVDLLEIPAIITVTLSFIAILKHKYHAKP